MSTPTAPLTELAAALRAELRGTVTTTAEETARFARDYRDRPAAPPAIVVYAQCEGDVVATFRLAAAAGVPVALRGAGHASNGRALCPGGLVLVNHVEEPRSTLHADDTVEVEARATWRALEAALRERGRTFPVLTDSLDLTVGGTLSVGGYGVRSVECGAQADHVLRLRLVQHDGTTPWCSRAERPELFDAALAGLGAAGAIERVVLRTVPLRRHFRGELHVHPSLAALAASLTWMADWSGDGSAALSFDAFQIDGMIISEYATDGPTADSIPALPPPIARRPAARRLSGTDYSAYAEGNRLRWLSRFPSHRPLWSDWFFDPPGFAAFLAFLDRAQAGGLPHLQAVYVLSCRPPAAGPRPPLLPDYGPRSFSVGLYFMVPAAADPAAARAARRRCEEQALALGGRTYRYGYQD